MNFRKPDTGGEEPSGEQFLA